MATKAAEPQVANGNIKPPMPPAEKPRTEKKAPTPYHVMQRIERALDALDGKDRDGVLAWLYARFPPKNPNQF